MKIIVLSPEVAVESATALSEALDATYENPYKTGNRNFSDYDIIFKYGFSRPIKVKKGAIILNKTKSIGIAMDKIKTFLLLKDKIKTVPFTQNKEEAVKWLKEGSVFARTTATASNSIGIHVCNTRKELDKVKDALFWTKYVEYTNEFRINVWKDTVISIYDKINNNIHFKFKLFQGQEKHPQLVELVKTIYEETKLDCYGLDVIRDNEGNLTLLEINSAPVLFPYTVKKLTTIIKKEYE